MELYNERNMETKNGNYYRFRVHAMEKKMETAIGFSVRVLAKKKQVLIHD